MNKKTYRQFSSLIWNAISPARYELVGYPSIYATFDGTEWQLVNVTVQKFRNMIELSQVIEVVAQNFTARGNKWSK